MKKIILPILYLVVIACSRDTLNELDDIDDIDNTTENSSPEFTIGQDFSIEEHSLSGASIGVISATDKDNDPLSYTIDSDFDLIIDETSGEITIGENTILDFEATPNITATISVFDGSVITDQTITITLENIDEYVSLTVEQKEFVDYFRYLALWEASNNLATIQKWGAPMKIFLDGTITTEYRATIESVLEQYNALFNLGDFTISIVDTEAESNAHLYFGEAAEIENLWEDMYEIIEGQSYDGYAISSGTTAGLNNSRIWISSPIASLLKHELGHALGLGHSNHCDDGTDKSFMCSTISQENDFLDSEKEIIRFLYHEDIAPGTSAEDINNAVSNLVLLNQ